MIRNQATKILDQALKKMSVKIELADFVLEHPQDSRNGDFSTNVAMRLAKQLKRPPLEIGREIVRQIEHQSSAKKLFEKIEVVPPGFINFFLTRPILTKELKIILKQKDRYANLNVGARKKLIVEHTSVNPNKAMHVGHLRNMAIGDSVAALMRKSGYKVEVENYIDDTGVQVADVLVALRHFNEKPAPNQKFDHFCWDIYSRIQKEYEKNPALLEERTIVQQAIEAGANDAADLVTKIIHEHLWTADRVGVYYDVFIFESSILRSGLWQKTFEHLKKSGKVVFEPSGVNQGCWVFKGLALSPDEKLKNPDKILVTSKGVAVYTAKDIAYHLWKFGRAAGDFKYQKVASQGNGQMLWASSPKGVSKKFGRSNAVINVIDVRQAYTQNVVKSALKELGLVSESENLRHLSYEVVSLSPATAQALGVSVEEGKGSYAMSGRKGIGVKADDLIDALVRRVEEIRGQEALEARAIDADAIVAAAIKAYMLKQSLNQEVVFDLDQALNLTGDSGPYLQYAHARIKGILRKAGKSRLFSRSAELKESEELELLRKIYIFPEMVEVAAMNLTPHVIYHYLLGLSQAFNTFYTKVPVLKAEPALRQARLAMILAVAHVIKNGLSLLGIQAPDRM